MPVARARLRPALCLLLVLAGLLPACAKRDVGHATASREPPPAAAAVAPRDETAPPEERAMRITVEMTVVVTHRDAATQALRASLADVGGYVSDGSLSGPDTSGSASFEVRVPAAKVGAFRAAIRALGDVRADSEKAEDVTEARADVRARLGNARAEEGRMLALLSDKTGSLADVVAVEKELSRVRETIERMEAEERVLLGQIAMATVKVQLETTYVPAPTGAGSRLSSAAKEGIEVAWAFLVGTGVFLLSAGPTLLIVIGLAYAGFLALRGLLRRTRKT